MERRDAELKIAAHLDAISRIVKEYGVPSGTLGMSIDTTTNYFTATNRYWDEDNDKQIHVSQLDGKLWFWGLDGEPDVQG